METLHILNGEGLRDYLREYLKNKEYICFNECMADGEVTREVFSEEFLTIRSKVLEKYYGVSSELYYEKTIKELNKLKDKTYKKIILWFDEDMFCQINLLTLLTYFSQHHYDGEVVVNLIKDQYWQLNDVKEIIEVSKKINIVTAFEELYRAVLMERKEGLEGKIYYAQVIKELPLLGQGIKLYQEYHKDENELTRFINERINWEEKKLVGKLLSTFRLYGLGDIQYFNLIKRCKEKCNSKRCKELLRNKTK